MTRKRMTYKNGCIKFTEAEKLASFWQKVDIRGPDECWLWKAGRASGGYGCFRYHNAHRFSLEIHLGRKLMKGEHALHDCPGGDNPLCVNPHHLYAGTNLDNIQDKVRKGRQRGGAGANQVRGANHPKAKLTDEDVQNIRHRIADGEVLTRIAEDHGVTIQLVSQIKRGKIWRHLK